MKRVLTVLLMLAVAASLFAGGVENKNKYVCRVHEKSKQKHGNKENRMLFFIIRQEQLHGGRSLCRTWKSVCF